MEKYFFYKEEKAFYVDSINNDIPDLAVQITEEQYKSLLTAINLGCVVFNDLTYSEPKPSVFHFWKNDKWVLDENEKLKHDIDQNEISKQYLLSDASQRINILQDAIGFNMSEDGDKEKLEDWVKYRILLSRVNTNVEKMELPEKPE